MHVSGVPTLDPVQYTGHADEAGVIKVLKGDLKAMFERRFDPNEYEQYDCKFTVQASLSPGGLLGKCFSLLFAFLSRQ